MKNKLMSILLILFTAIPCMVAQITYPSRQPGKATIHTKDGGNVILENNVVKMEFGNDGKRIRILNFENKETNDHLNTGSMPWFEMVLPDSSVIASNEFMVRNLKVDMEITGDPVATTYAERLSGKGFSADLEHIRSGVSLHWEAILRDGSNYIRQVFRIKTRDPNGVSKIILLKLPGNRDLKREGSVEGSPVVNKDMFFAVEYPLSKVEQNATGINAYLQRLLPVVSTVWGVTPENQMRRGFLYYLERERIHPYHQMLHYNSWYDISWNSRKFDEKECLDRIRVFGDSLITKRKVQMNAFLFDDGWDDNKTLWRFHSGFPEGFTPITKSLKNLNAGLGVWLSPFGGYDTAKMLRLEYGKKQIPPFETNERGFSLSGPVYYNRFREVTGNFIKSYDVSIFKFDGVGAGSGAGIVYQKDVEAFLKLLKDLLAIKPGIYLSLTSGTWPSVYWLMYGDNIWRGGDDTNILGDGSKRQQWITYRDADTYRNMVTRGPLFPLNALMLCGICIADYGLPGTFEMDERDISDEIWSFFATGTSLQEMYINPHKLTAANWDCLAEASKWAKGNETVMADMHWVGGDPSKKEVYGFAAWSPDKAILSLRNPAAVEQAFEVNGSRIFELPAHAVDEFLFYDARSGTIPGKGQVFATGKSFEITLQPFEIMVFNVVPRKQ